MKIRVLLADDHFLIRTGMRQLLQHHIPNIEISEAESGRVAMDRALNEDWDLMVLDLELPDRSGLEVLTDIKLHKPELPVLILTGHQEEEFAIRILKAQGDGFISKQNAPQEIVTAVRKVLAGGKYISATLADKLVHELTAESGKLPHEKLSDREFEVMRRLAAGEKITDIATRISLSPKTVSTYRARIMEKLGFASNADLTRYAIENRLI
jgi:two-component system invasion response regulator UvrY